ncbi:thiolase family protein [Nocardia sp. NPDC056064]|uniref:thiolase family protein n=1 Tax=Nocardia sp. NPDC056064 TaxID=3345701 RepID=UPI0035E37A9D
MSAVIVDVVRTPSGRGKPGGGLSSVHPATLLAGVLAELVARTGIDPALVDDVIGGCVTQSGEQANNISRTAVLAAGFPESVPATTVDRQCGSSQQAVHFAAQGVLAGAYDVAIACGVESMSRAPMFSNTQGKDSLRAPLAARYPDGLIGQGIAAEILAARWKLDRATLDEFAARSHRLAAATAAAGGFDAELVGAGELTADETIRTGTTVEGLAGLRPAFTDPAALERFPEIGWSVTAGNSSPLTDGASAALIMSEAMASKLGLTPRARFHSFAVTGDDPTLMLTAVIPATRKALDRVSLTVDDIDTFEVNEAFAPVPLVWQHELGADPERVNPRGGAIALGHPLGASGTRLLATMVNHLEQTGGRYGLQTMCEAGGLANATIIERL